MKTGHDYKEIIENLFGPLASKDGETKANVVATEKQNGFRLPKVLRDYYQLTGRLDSLNQAHNQLVPLDRLEVIGGALVFFVESEAGILWGILLENIKMTDPPVFQAEDGEEDVLEWELDHRYLSDFLVTMAYWQATSGGLEHSAVASITPQMLDRIRQHWQPIRLSEDAWDMDLFGNGGQLLCVLAGNESEPMLIAASKTAEDLEEISTTLDIEWLNEEEE